MNRELRDILDLRDFNAAVVGNTRVELGASVVSLQSEQLDPMTTIVLQCPGDESQLPWGMVKSDASAQRE